MIPWIDQAHLKVDADLFLPIVSRISNLIPGVQGVAIVAVLQAIVDNDNIRVPVVDLINKLDGAKPPA